MCQIELLDEYHSLREIVRHVLKAWPDHDSYCGARFRDDKPDFLERTNELAGLVLALAGRELQTYCEDYKWMCEQFVAEEYFFRANGHYRLSSFKEVFECVYNDPSYMSRYVHGILLSQLIWTPHARAFDFFRTDFLPKIPPRTRYLEVGPGHGLFLYFAAKNDNISALEAWDVSFSSIAATRRALNKLGIKRPINLIEQDVLGAPQYENIYGGAIISEVLEHLEAPNVALRTLYATLQPGGRIFINIPINSPAPDHIYLWSSAEEVINFVREQGFEIESSQLFPATGVSLERAIKRNQSISCIVIGRKPS